MNKIIKFLKEKQLLTFIKFAITGVANTLIDFAVYTLLSSVFMVNIYVSQTFGYLCGMINSYLINHSWTFKSDKKLLSSELFRFILTNLIMLVLSLFTLKFATDYLMLAKIPAKILVTAFTLCLNFVLSKLWVFKK
ncbi:MAG: GtrA family protein [Oscillospiraceae bacterium]